MISSQLLCLFGLLLPALLVLLPILLPPALIRLAHFTSKASAYLEHKLAADLSAESWEYIVVGAGSAGSVVAGRLAAAGHSVLLIEAGGSPSYVAHIPAMVPLLQKSPVDWALVTEPSSKSHLGSGGVSHWPRGKLLGGSSILNYMLYVRGNARDYEEWADMGLEGWGYQDVLPFFKKSEDFVGDVEDREEYHGQGGDMKVTSEGHKQPIIDTFLQAGEELGYKVGDFNGAVQEDIFTSAHTTTHRGFRSGTYKAFAERFAGQNLTVLTHTHVTKVLIGAGRAMGVEVDRFGERIQLTASREVVLSAGSVGTPQILLLSGIGDEGHLREVGIEPVVHLPDVGSNLQDHLMVSLMAEFNADMGYDPYTSFYPSSWLSLARGEGPFDSSGCGGLAHVRTELQDPRDPRPDIQFHMVALSLAVDWGLVLAPNFGFSPSDDIMPWLAEHYGKHTGSVTPVLSRPKSRGFIKLRSSDPFDHPIIQPNYLDDPRDMESLVAGIKLAQKVMETEAFKKAGTKFFSPLPYCSHLTYGSDPYWECYVRHMAFTIYHPVGTAAMGTVLDARLRVKGVEGLRVADGSVMPNIVGGNTNAPIIMIGEKAADMIIADASLQLQSSRTDI